MNVRLSTEGQFRPTEGEAMAVVWWYSRIRRKQVTAQGQAVIWLDQMAEEFAAMMAKGALTAHVN